MKRIDERGPFFRYLRSAMHTPSKAQVEKWTQQGKEKAKKGENSSPPNGYGLPEIFGCATQTFLVHSFYLSAVTALGVLAFNRLKQRTVIPFMIPLVQSILSAFIFTLVVDGSSLHTRQNHHKNEYRTIGRYKGTGIVLFWLISPLLIKLGAQRMVNVSVRTPHTWTISTASVAMAILIEIKR